MTKAPLLSPRGSRFVTLLAVSIFCGTAWEARAQICGTVASCAIAGDSFYVSNSGINGVAVVGQETSNTSGSIGVLGENNAGVNGIGVYAEANTGTALYTIATSGTAVSVNTSSGVGVLVATLTGDGVEASTGSAGESILATMTGTGYAINAQITNSSDSKAAIFSATNGSGPGVQAKVTGTGAALDGEINNTSSSANAVYAYTNGTGNTVSSHISNTTTTNHAIYGVTNGLGAAIYGSSTSNAVGGEFITTSTSHGSLMLDPVAKLTGNCLTSGEMYMSTEPHLYVCLTASTPWTKIQ